MSVFALLYTGALLASIAEGAFLILPLYVKQMGGDEVAVGWILWGSAFGALLLVGNMSRLLARARPATIAALGCAAYAGGAGIFALWHGLGWPAVGAGFLQGAGVGLCVATYPIVITGMVEDSKRSAHFSVLAAFGIAGMGISPPAAAWLVRAGVSYGALFAGSALMCVACAVIFSTVSRMTVRAPRPSMHEVPRRALRSVLRSAAVDPLIMVFLGACMFSSVMTFQTTFARERGLDFQTFYVCYIISTIVARLALSHVVGRARPRSAIVALLVLMCASLAAFAIVGSNPIVYALAACALGASYGLVYPLIQAHAVNLTRPELRERVLAYFSFSYFVAVYGFPLAAGAIIVRFGYQWFALCMLALGAAELAVAIAHLRRGEARAHATAREPLLEATV